MKVHCTLGNGFQEVNISYVREKLQTIFYKGTEVGKRSADFVIEEAIVLEIKAFKTLEDTHLVQAKNYLIAYDLPIGLLINFGATSLQYKKVYGRNPKLDT